MTDRVGKSARWSPERAHDNDEVAAVPNFGKPDWWLQASVCQLTASSRISVFWLNARLMFLEELRRCILMHYVAGNRRTLFLSREFIMEILPFRGVSCWSLFGYQESQDKTRYKIRNWQSVRILDFALHKISKAILYGRKKTSLALCCAQCKEGWGAGSMICTKPSNSQWISRFRVGERIR